MLSKRLDETERKGKGVSSLWSKLWLLQGWKLCFHSSSSTVLLEQGEVPPYGSSRRLPRTEWTCLQSDRPQLFRASWATRSNLRMHYITLLLSLTPFYAYLHCPGCALLKSSMRTLSLSQVLLFFFCSKCLSLISSNEKKKNPCMASSINSYFKIFF